MAGGTTPNKRLPFLPTVPTDRNDWLRLRGFLVALKEKFEGIVQNPDPPDHITGLTLEVKPTGVHLTWNPSNRATSYVVYRALDSIDLEDASAVGWIARSGSVSFYDPAGQDITATRRTYWVQAKNGLVDGPVSVAVTTTSADTIGSGAVAGLSGTNTGDVTLAGTPNYITLAGQVITRALIDLTTHVTGRLPFANYVAAVGGLSVVARPVGTAGSFSEVPIGAGLAFSGGSLVATGTGDVVGPSGATDNAIARFDTATGKLIQNSGITISDAATGTLAGSNSGDVTLAGAPTYLTIVGQVITRTLIDLASQVSGRLPFANYVAATGGSILVGRRSGSGGNFEEITLGAGLSMASTVISATTGGSAPSTNDFRLTLASALPVYTPRPATPSSTDTTAETCTFAAAHGWESGTIVTVSATIGGLTAATRYYLNKVSTTVVSFHTNVADALAGTSKVNLTASITSQVIPSGISNTTLYFTPHIGAQIGLYNGSTWDQLTSAEVSIALGTLTSGKNYDVYAYNNSGTLTLELLAWTDDSTRATALVRQDGVWSKTGALTRRLVGTIRTDSTTTTIDDGGGIASQVGAKRFVWNASNRVSRSMLVRDFTVSYSLNTGAFRQANAAAGNKNEYVIGLTCEAQTASVQSLFTSNVNTIIGINLDSITATPLVTGANQSNSYLSIAVTSPPFEPLPGYHYHAWMECITTAVSSATFAPFGNSSSISGLSGAVWA